MPRAGRTTPLMYAKTRLQDGTTNDRSVLIELLQSGADLRRVDVFGLSIFDYLERAGATELAGWLKLLENDLG